MPKSNFIAEQNN